MATHDFRNILDIFHGAAVMSFEDIDKITEEHLYDVLAELPRISSLPTPHELERVREIYGNCPAVLETTVSLGDIGLHLQDADEHTPEIGMQTYRDGTTTFFVGDVERVMYPLGWDAIGKNALLDFHTHPDPADAEVMIDPSIDDLRSLVGAHSPGLIGSVRGLTLVPAQQQDTNMYREWSKYVTEVRELDEEAFMEYGATKVYHEFAVDIAKAHHIGWSAVTGAVLLADAAQVADSAYTHPHQVK